MSLMFLQTCAQSNNKVADTKTGNKKEETKPSKQTTAQETIPKDEKIGLGLVMFHCM